MITKRQFNTFEDLFNYYNSELFNGELKEVMINMSRKKNSHGFFARDRWKSIFNSEYIHEISLNPESLNREPIAWHSTLVHEMVHLWRLTAGKPPRPGYHDRVWADKMEAIGLNPSDTGQPGGKRTGPRMTHYVVPGGLFEKAFQAIQGEEFEEMILPFLPTITQSEKPPKGVSKGGTRVKYTCECDTNIWGSGGLDITCNNCGLPFKPSE